MHTSKDVFWWVVFKCATNSDGEPGFIVFFLSGEAAKFLDTNNDIKVDQGSYLTYLLAHYKSDKSF